MFNLFCIFIKFKQLDNTKSQNFLNESNISETMTFLYNNIYTYMLNLLINNPPISSKLKRLYRKLFESIDFTLFW